MAKAYLEREEHLLMEGGVPGLALDTSGRYLAFTPYLDRVMVWDLQTARPWSMTWGAGGGNGIVFSLDGRYVYHSAQGFRIWDFRQERQVKDCVDWNQVIELQASRDGSFLLGGGVTPELYLRRMGETPCRSETLFYEPVHDYMVAKAVHAGRKVLAVGEGPVVASWDLQRRRRLMRLLMRLPGHRDVVAGLDFDPEGKRLASGSQDGTIRLWDAVGGTLLASWDAHPRNTDSFEVAFDPSGRFLASGVTGPDDEQSIKIWDLSGHDLGPGMQPRFSFAAVPDKLVFDPMGRFLVSTGSDARVQFWDYRQGKLLLTIQALPPAGQWLVYTPDGRFDFSPQSAQYLSWKAEGKSWPLSRFQAQYYVPGLLAEVIKALPAGE